MHAALKGKERPPSVHLPALQGKGPSSQVRVTAHIRYSKSKEIPAALAKKRECWGAEKDLKVKEPHWEGAVPHYQGHPQSWEGLQDEGELHRVNSNKATTQVDGWH